MQEQRVVGGEAMGPGGAALAAGGPGAVSGDAKKPMAAFSIVERKGLEKPLWTRVGAAFVNRDGSINIYLDSLPLQGKIQLRDEPLRARERNEPPRRPRPPVHDGD